MYVHRYNIETDREFTADVSIEIYGQCAAAPCRKKSQPADACLMPGCLQGEYSIV